MRRIVRPSSCHLLVVQAAGGFVEEKQLRLGGERARQFHPLLRPERKAGGGPVAHAAEVERGDELFHLRAQFRLPPARAGEAQGVAREVAAAARMRADEDVVDHRQVPEQGEVLKRAADADAGNAVRRAPQDAASLEEDVAGGRRVEPAQAVEERRLAGSVRADEAENLSVPEIEGDVVEGEDAAEPHGHVRHR